VGPPLKNQLEVLEKIRPKPCVGKFNLKGVLNPFFNHFPINPIKVLRKCLKNLGNNLLKRGVNTLKKVGNPKKFPFKKMC